LSGFHDVTCLGVFCGNFSAKKVLEFSKR